MALLTAGCSGGGGEVDDLTLDERDGPNAGPVPTIPGGVDLGAADPGVVLVGAELAFGSPLPSEQAAAARFAEGDEVVDAVVRRVYVAANGRRLGTVTVLVLDGAAFFDEEGLAAFERGLVQAGGPEPVAEVTLAGQLVLRSGGEGFVRLGFRRDNLLSLVVGATDADVNLTVTRQLEALARGESGSLAPATPLPALPGDAAFVAVPTVAFAPIPDEPDDPAPEPPSFPGATGVHGRYGVVAGERRTVVWAYTLDTGTYASAEALAGPMRDLAEARSGGGSAREVELVDRVVVEVDGRGDAVSARVFRHHGLVLLVEGARTDQVDAVTSAWVAALAATGG